VDGIGLELHSVKTRTFIEFLLMVVHKGCLSRRRVKKFVVCNEKEKTNDVRSLGAEGVRTSPYKCYKTSFVNILLQNLDKATNLGFKSRLEAKEFNIFIHLVINERKKKDLQPLISII
jgi:hypothetical protein